jgi:hypothetical protein
MNERVVPIAPAIERGDADLQPPADDHAERDALGGVLLHPELADVMVGRLEANDFRRDAHRRVFKAIVSIHQAGGVPDMRAIRGQLQDTGDLGEVGLPYLFALVDDLPPRDAAAMTRLCDRLRAISRARRLYYEAGELSTAVARHPHQTDEILAVRLPRLQQEEQSDAVTPLLNDATLLEQPDAPDLVEGLLFAGSFITLIGAPGVGKSLLAMDLALSVAAGVDWLGAPVRKRGPVLAIIGEGAAGWKPRVRAWKTSHGFAPEEVIGLHMWPQAVNFMEPAEVQQFIRLVRKIRPVLVVGDTLARCLIGGDENSARDMGLLVRHTDEIRAMGTGFLWSHHTNRAATGERGSSALRGACDTMMSLSAADDLLTLTCEKQKDAAPFEPRALRLVREHGSVIVRVASGSTGKAALTQAQVRLLVALRDHFADGATSGEWRAVVPDVPERSFYRATRNLIRLKAVRQSGGRYRLVDGSVLREHEERHQ